jgi:hypothetical protein
MLTITLGLAGLLSSQDQIESQGVARILGTAVQPDGTPAIGGIEIEPVSKENPSAVAVISGIDGSFETEKLPPGRYRVGVDLEINIQPDEAYGRTYYPGTTDRSNAVELEIAQGLPEPRIVFVVPKVRPLIQLRGTVVYEDGKPAAGVDVFFSPVGGYSIAQVWTDSKGNCSQKKYGAVAYRIQSRSRDSKYESQVQVVEAVDLERPILLVLRGAASAKP